MPRLLILCEYSTLLGGERSMLATLPIVQAAGFEVYVGVPAVGPLAEAVEKSKASHVPMRSRDELPALIDRVHPQLIHANSLSMARIAGPVAAAAGIPSIGHLRDIVGLSRQAIADVNRHRRLIAVSEATREFHVEQGIDAAKCMVSHNGVDLTLFHPRPSEGKLHRELSLPADAKLVATIGQIGLRKGTEVALAAARLVMRELENAHWLVVGERTSDKDESRDFEAQLHAMAKEPPLAGRVHFVGTRGDMPELLAECALVVHAARQEPLGRVLLEAAASGVAVVATNVGGTREIFPADADGAVLVPRDDADAIAAAAMSLLSDHKRRAVIGAGGRRRAEAAFDVRMAAARLIEHFRAVL